MDDMRLCWRDFRCPTYDNIPPQCQLVASRDDPSCCQVPQCVPTPGPNGYPTAAPGATPTPTVFTNPPGVVTGIAPTPSPRPGYPTPGYRSEWYNIDSVEITLVSQRPGMPICAPPHFPDNAFEAVPLCSSVTVALSHPFGVDRWLLPFFVLCLLPPGSRWCDIFCACWWYRLYSLQLACYKNLQ